MPSLKSNYYFALNRLAIVFLSLMLINCGNGAYNTTSPNADEREILMSQDAIASVQTSDAKFAYIFSNNHFSYQPCTGTGVTPCPETLVVGNPVHSYQIDTVSGMTTPVGIEADSPPPNTKSFALSPSGRFMYVLSGDNQIDTFSIGFSTFTVAEFTKYNLDPRNLYSELSKAGYLSGKAVSSEEMVAQLNGLLERPDLYFQIIGAYPNLVETAEIVALKAETASSRTKQFAALSEKEKKSLIRLNRLMIELALPALTPVNAGAMAQHAVGKPVATLPSFNNEYKSFTSVEIEPTGNHLYVLGRKGADGSPAIAIYTRDIASGKLVLSQNQTLTINKTPYALDQLIFSASGLFAYGSNNGSLHSFTVNPDNGLLVETGTPFTFRGWLEGADFNTPGSNPWQKAPFKNMVADPGGKFLFLIASSGTQITPPQPFGACPAVGSKHQLGSLIYTFAIDADSGVLTQAGPPLDTTPHIITAASVDSKGRFVQLLNTHEYQGSNFTPDACGEVASTALLNVGSVYSYYVEQATGKLISSGSLQAGGTQLLNGFVVGGMDSVSLTGNLSGRFLYLLNSQDLYVYNVDQANGALTVIGSPLTGATTSAMPGKYETPITWPSLCLANGVNQYCTYSGASRSHSLTWARQ